MARDTAFRSTDNSPEHVAYKLLQDIMSRELRTMAATGDTRVDRKYILDTYAECLLAVRAPESR